MQVRGFQGDGIADTWAKWWALVGAKPSVFPPALPLPPPSLMRTSHSHRANAGVVPAPGKYSGFQGTVG